ncbi:MAG: tRNA (adenosine(37)-N6)-threonylcarbamoyltransferase complex ATPase subunit type 1 TsaE [Planctomycetota bacterium]
MDRELGPLWLSPAAECTHELGVAFGRAAQAGWIFALEGDLGAGKTCFVSGLAEGLGIDEVISSPTFTLMQAYEGRLPLLHFDAWMEGRERAFLQDGGAEELHSGRAVCAIEWAGKVEALLPKPFLWVGLGHRTLEERTLQLGLAGQDLEMRRCMTELPLEAGLRALPETPAGGGERS